MTSEKTTAKSRSNFERLLIGLVDEQDVRRELEDGAACFVIAAVAGERHRQPFR